MIYTAVTDKDDVRIIRLLVDNIMFHNYEQIFNKIKGSISDDISFIVLDMEKVAFMDSLSIGMLVPLLLYARRLDGDLVVVNAQDNIRKLFEILRLDKIIRLYGNVDEAVASFGTVEEIE